MADIGSGRQGAAVGLYKQREGSMVHVLVVNPECLCLSGELGMKAAE